jgi:hypothetical protein
MEEAALAGLLHEIVNYAESKSFPSAHLHDEIDRLLGKKDEPAPAEPADPDVSYTGDEVDPTVDGPAPAESFGTESQPE